MKTKALSLSKVFTRSFFLLTGISLIFSTFFVFIFSLQEENKIAIQRDMTIESKVFSLKDHFLLLSIIGDTATILKKIDLLKADYPDYQFCLSTDEYCSLKNEVVFDIEKKISVKFERTNNLILLLTKKIISSGLLLSYVFIFLIAILTIRYLLRKYVLIPIGIITDLARNPSGLQIENSRISQLGGGGVEEWGILGESLIDLSKFLLLEQAQIRQAELSNIAKQVAHDIRSPLTALNMITSTLSELPEEKRIIIRSATQRINDIANNLLEQSKQVKFNNSTSVAQNPSKLDGQDAIALKNSISNSGVSQNDNLNNILSVAEHEKQIPLNSEKNEYTPQPELIAYVVDSIVSEKRIQFRDKINVHIDADLSEAYGLFANISPSEFKRVLSNLINNSVEALPNEKGSVSISIRGYSDKISVVVFDNGKGIPEEYLSRLGKEEGLSFGKEANSGSGSGLGLYHARKIIESFSGGMQIQSQLGQGTMITITLPRSKVPDWFVERIRLAGITNLVSLDDDSSIHLLWEQKFKEREDFNINHLKYTSGEDFKKFVGSLSPNVLPEYLFLVDYELLNQKFSGIDLITLLKIEKHSILVTSRFDDSRVRDFCSKSRVRLIPKTMAARVSLE